MGGHIFMDKDKWKIDLTEKDSISNAGVVLQVPIGSLDSKKIKILESE